MWVHGGQWPEILPVSKLQWASLSQNIWEKMIEEDTQSSYFGPLCIHTYTCTPTHTCAHMHTYAHIHTHTHTHTHKPWTVLSAEHKGMSSVSLQSHCPVSRWCGGTDCASLKLWLGMSNPYAFRNTTSVKALSKTSLLTLLALGQSRLIP